MFPALHLRFFSGDLGLNWPSVVSLRAEEFRIGRSQLFLTEEAFTFLKKLESFLIRSYVMRIKRSWNLWQTRRMKSNLINLEPVKENSAISDMLFVDSGAGDAPLCTNPFRQLHEALSPGNPRSDGDTEITHLNLNDSGSRIGLKPIGSGHQYFYILHRATEEEMECIVENLNLRRRNGILTRGQLFQVSIN